MTSFLRAATTAMTLILSTVSASSVMAQTSEAAAASEDAKFETIYKTEWQWRKRLYSADEDSGGDKISATLPDMSKAAQDRQLKYWKDVLARLTGIDTAKLSDPARINFTIYKYQIETLIAGQEFRLYEKPLTGDTAFWSDLTYTARASFKTEADYRNYISQLNAFPLYFQQNIDNMKVGLKRGFTPPRITLQGRDSSAASIAEARTIEDNLYYTPFTKFPANIPLAKQAELKQLGTEAIRAKVVPAHRALLKFLRDEYIPKAQTSTAAYDLPDGKAFYQSQIREYTTLDLTPDQIHQIGLEEVAKIKAEMFEVMREVKFEGDLPAFLNFLRTDPQFYVTTPQALLDRAAWTAKQFDAKSGDYFGHLPRRRFAIIEAPADIAPFYTAGRGGPGVYIVNTYNLKSRPLYSLPALTLHESAPGHAFQMPLAAENKNLPEFRQNAYISAYGEGWALYSERLGVEMGIYTTPYERFGMLSYQMWRAARLVVDTGLHAKGWTRQQALDFLHENTALSDHEITTETDRYISWPGQALSYYLGEMAIWDARRKAEAALGEQFNIRAFHDTVLELGCVPLPVLGARIDKFIQDGGKGPYPDED